MKLRSLPFLFLSPIAALLLGSIPVAHAQNAAGVSTAAGSSSPAPVAQASATPGPAPVAPVAQVPVQQAPAPQAPAATQPAPAPSQNVVYTQPSMVGQDYPPEPYYEEPPRRSRHARRARHARRPERRRYVPGEALAPGMLPPPVFRYFEGTPLPEGYHIESRANRGLVRAGVITLALPYLVSAVVGISQDLKGSSAWLLLPVAGPWLTLSSRRTRCREIGDPTFGGGDCFADEYGAGLLIADGAVQTLGALLVTWGVLATRDYAVLNEAHLRVSPLHFAHGSYGLALSGAL